MQRGVPRYEVVPAPSARDTSLAGDALSDGDGRRLGPGLGLGWDLGELAARVLDVYVAGELLERDLARDAVEDHDALFGVRTLVALEDGLQDSGAVQMGHGHGHLVVALHVDGRNLVDVDGGRFEVVCGRKV